MIFIDKFLGALKRRNDNDFVDRLNYYYTPFLLSFFSLTLSAKQYAGQPIQCWVPAQYTGAWEQYAEYFCFVKNTYFVPFTEELPLAEEARENREIGYYQWVPFILALQAFLFFLPIMVWRLFNWHSGIWVKGILNAAGDVNCVDEEKRDKNAKAVATHIRNCLDVQQDYKYGKVGAVLFYGKHFGVYVTYVYLFVKALFVINVIGQFFLLNAFLGPQYSFWGFSILRDILAGRTWEESGHFPRVTMCDFKVRVLGNLHNHSIQCVLMINMFNEKIYLFLWWWFLIVAIVTIINFLRWLAGSLSKGVQHGYVSHYLRVYASMKGDDKVDTAPMPQRAIDNFVDNKLRPDGVLLLRLVEANSGDVAATAVAGALYEMAQEKKYVPPPPSITGEKQLKDRGDERGFVENLPTDEKA